MKSKAVTKTMKRGVSTQIGIRKEKRKQKREEKKKHRHLNHLKKAGKLVEEADQANVKHKAKAKGHHQSNKTLSNDHNAKQTNNKVEELKKLQLKQRRKRLLEENKKEDQILQSLEKKLKLNKVKNKNKAFQEDGLDFLLDLCESDKMPEDISDDEDLESGSDQEEDHEEEASETSDVERKTKEEGSEDDSDLDDCSDDDALDDLSDADENVDAKEESDQDEEEDEKESSDTAEPSTTTYEDIYGRTRSSDGQVVPAKYIPPALRAKMVGDSDAKRKEALRRLKNKLKGLLNRLATSNMSGICKQIEGIYRNNSNNDTNECLCALLSESLTSKVPTPERFILEHALLVGILHVNVGNEVGAEVLQSQVRRFDNHYIQTINVDWDALDEPDKTLDNCLLLICHLYSFKVVDALMVFDLFQKLINNFRAKDIELMLVLLKAVGFSLRKDDPAKLKEMIVQVQKKSVEKEELKSCSRTKFMLDVLNAIKNNNVKKIPNYDSEHLQLLNKMMKTLIKPGVSSLPLRISLEDLLRADERGRWWVVGGAWAGRDDTKTRDHDDKVGTPSFSSDLLDLARKMRMNTDIRRAIFCTIMSADDYIEAFEKLLKLNLKHQQKEVTFVLVDCGLQEKSFNPYYAQLTSKLAEFDRKYRIAAQFSIWDKIKILPELNAIQKKNLAAFTYFLIKERAFPITGLKVIELGSLDKINASFLKKVLLQVLKLEDDQLGPIFEATTKNSKNKLFREGLRLFLRQFILKRNENNADIVRKVTLAEDHMSLS